MGRAVMTCCASIDCAVPPLRSVCAWCEHDLPPAQRATGDDVTHGICPRHAAEVRQEIKRIICTRAAERWAGEPRVSDVPSKIYQP